MLFKLEMKKLFIKQHALILIILVVIVKAFNSASLFKPDYSTLSKDQQNYYLNYVAQYGGKLTDDKEAAILELYQRAAEANAQLKSVEDNYNSGFYETDREYFEALANVPEIAREYDAIKYLYNKYATAASDRENRAILPGCAKAMTTGAEYLLVILICFLSARAVFYERNMSVIAKTTASAERSAAMRAAALLIAVLSVWLMFAGIEFAATTNAVGAENLGFSVVSVDDFQNTPYPNLSIVQTFVLIQLTKLCGYLLIASVTVILSLLIKNLPLAIFIPFACTFVWIYLFNDANLTYCSPFSLILGSPYFTGDYYLREGNLEILLYSAVPLSQTLFPVAICITATAIAAFVMIGKSRNLRKCGAAFAAACLCLLCGCSRSVGDDGIYQMNYSNIVSDGENFYALSDITDENGVLLERHLSVFDKELNLVNNEISRRIMENLYVEEIQISGNYLYCKKSDENNRSEITRINLENFHEETIYRQPDQGGHAAYLDLVTVWTDSDDLVGHINEWFVGGDDIYIFTSEGKAFCVHKGQSKYLFEDLKINCPAMRNGKIYYLDANGCAVCWDGEKTVMSDRSFYGARALSDGFYAYNDGGIYRIDYSDHSTEKVGESSEKITEIYEDGILFQNVGGFIFTDKNGNEKAYGINEHEYNFAFIDGEFYVCAEGNLNRRN